MDTFRCKHPKTPENSRPKRDGKGNIGPTCRTCFNASEQRRKARRRAGEKAGSRAQPTHQERAVTFPVEPLLTFARTRRLSTDQERAIERARREGRLTLLAADKVACGIGIHPGLIWPEWWEVGAA